MGAAAAAAVSSPGDPPPPAHALPVVTPQKRTPARTQLALPYWQENPDARWRLAGVVALTLGTTGVSVLFNFLGRDFFNALAEKDADRFARQLVAYLGGFAVGVPVYVLRSYFQSRLALEWREGMTRSFMARYMRDRSFYQLAAGGGGAAVVVDNPDQRIASDVRSFTDTCLSLALTLLNAGVDLVSFSGILFGIYPPLFAALLIYAVGGTAISLRVGRPLVALNFAQEAREADLRYSLVRVRENAEAVAFYGGEAAEERSLAKRLRAAVDNYANLLVASRNLDFFTSFYRFLIQLLPAAVVAPLFFAGKIEFGVVNQSQSAFGHVLSDVSLVVYQLEALAGFSAVVDRLGEFGEVVDSRLRHDWGGNGGGAGATATATATASGSSLEEEEDAAAAASAGAAAGAADVGTIRIVHVRSDAGPCSRSAASSLGGEGEGAGSGAATQTGGGRLLLELEAVSVSTPDGRTRLVRGLSLAVREGESLLVMGPSGTGKTSVLRVLAGLWSTGEGSVFAHGLPGLGLPGNTAMGAGGGGGGAAATDNAATAADADDDDPGAGRVLFLPQKPYMVLGSLRDQLLYPTWATSGEEEEEEEREDEEQEGGDKAASAAGGSGKPAPASAKTSLLPPLPSDDELVRVLVAVKLGGLLDRCAAAVERAAAAAADASAAAAATAAAAVAPGAPAIATPAIATPAGSAPASPLDLVADWAATLSLGEQQRLAFARLLLARPRLALLDEATSALDVQNEARVYGAARAAGVTLVSVGHRPTLARFHERVLRLVPSSSSKEGEQSGSGSDGEGGGGGGGGGGCSWRVDRAEDVMRGLGAGGGGAAGGADDAALWSLD